MNAAPAEQQPVDTSQEELLASVRATIGGSRRPNDDEPPGPPGPWDPVIRVALERVTVSGPQPDPWKVFGPGPQPWRSLESVFGPHPDPWRLLFAILAARHPEVWEIVGGGPGSGTVAALNPQPLPPRFAFLVSLAQTVTSRAELLQEVADAMRGEGEGKGVAGGYLARFVDDCGNGLRPKWPFPWPPPPWFAKELSGIDLVVMAAHFSQAANEAFNPEFRQSLADTSARLAETGLAQMQ